MISTDRKFKIHISSKHKLLDLHVRETIQYRDLIFMFVKKNFTAQYKQTVLGPAWAVIKPLLTTFVINLVFGNLAGLTRADAPGDYMIPAFVFYLSGNICWEYFSSTLSATSNTFLYNRATMGKVYYPRMAAPVSTALSGLISFGIQFAMLLIIWLYFVIKGGTSIRITPFLLLIPAVIIQLMVLSVGLGIIISSVTTRYRDLAMLVGFGLSLWHYACPIAYGLQLVPEAYQGLYMLNPVAPILTTFRYAMFGVGYFDIRYYAFSWIISLAVLFVGMIMFSRIERSFMDTI